MLDMRCLLDMREDSQQAAGYRSLEFRGKARVGRKIQGPVEFNYCLEPWDWVRH